MLLLAALDKNEEKKKKLVFCLFIFFATVARLNFLHKIKHHPAVFHVYHAFAYQTSCVSQIK